MTASAIAIREFQSGDGDCFRKLNEEWITRYFRIEPKDVEALADPRSGILADGGRILLAIADGQCVGCCALIRLSADEFEVAKMAVTPAWQGSGIGRKLLQATIDTARAAGAHRLYLETNRRLETAIRLYRSVGIPARAARPDRAFPVCPRRRLHGDGSGLIAGIFGREVTPPRSGQTKHQRRNCTRTGR